ncbi:MAG: CheR family methyltransferase [Candidatus Binatia bacterium]
MTAGDWTDPGFEAVARLLGARTGLAFAPNRCAEAEVGIRRAMTRGQVADVGCYLRLLESGDLALDDLIAEMTVGETYFFRQPEQFGLIRSDVIPDVLRRRGHDHRLRVWSAGCASGEEAYTVAILMEEAALGGRAHILGTDISRPALARARNGSYGRWSLRGLDDVVIQRYFRRAGDRWLLDERIRTRVAFEFLNIALDAYPSLATGAWGMDLILCRNVLIYFDRETVRRVAARLHGTLADGGWLVTGPSDPPLGDDAPYETVVTRAGVFYRKTGFVSRVFAPSGEQSLPPLTCPASGPAPEALPSRLPATVAAPETDRRRIADARDPDRVPDPARHAAEEVEAAVLRVRALANQAGAEVTVDVAAEEARRHPLSPELHFLHAVLLLELGRDGDAARAVKRALYLDRSLAVAHFLLASILRRGGHLEAARQAYRNARNLAAASSPDEAVPLGDGERAGRLVAAASAEIALFDRQPEAGR